MIDFLRGPLAHRETDYVVLDVGGVGYRVFCPNPYAFADEGKTYTLFIHHHVREDAILLYGFATRDEQTMFRKLLEVSGVGPKVALGILSAGRPDAIVAAIYQEDLTFLTRLPGIGKKTAQRIVLDLKDKLADMPAAIPAAVGAAAAGRGPVRPAPGGGEWGEAKLALLALGYTEAETDRVWPAVKEKAAAGASVDAYVKLALQELFKG